MLNIKKDSFFDYHQSSLLFESGKACFVLARTSLEYALDFRVPGLLLMQQGLENLIKAILRQNKIQWPAGNNGHNFLKLLRSSGDKIPLFQEILLRQEICDLLEQLREGYNAQRYGESGHFFSNHEGMMDLFDEMAFKLIEEYGKKTGRTGEKLERYVAVTVPFEFRNRFCRKLKQPFVLMDPMD